MPRRTHSATLFCCTLPVPALQCTYAGEELRKKGEDAASEERRKEEVTARQLAPQQSLTARVQSHSVRFIIGPLWLSSRRRSSRKFQELTPLSHWHVATGSEPLRHRGAGTARGSGCPARARLPENPSRPAAGPAAPNVTVTVPRRRPMIGPYQMPGQLSNKPGIVRWWLEHAMRRAAVLRPVTLGQCTHGRRSGQAVA